MLGMCIRHAASNTPHAHLGACKQCISPAKTHRHPEGSHVRLLKGQQVNASCPIILLWVNWQGVLRVLLPGGGWQRSARVSCGGHCC
jgi:hypothetical protein